VRHVFPHPEHALFLISPFCAAFFLQARCNNALACASGPLDWSWFPFQPRIQTIKSKKHIHLKCLHMYWQTWQRFLHWLASSSKAALPTKRIHLWPAVLWAGCPTAHCWGEHLNHGSSIAPIPSWNVSLLEPPPPAFVFQCLSRMSITSNARTQLIRIQSCQGVRGRMRLQGRS
jgi:hypothetical protein